MEVLSLYQNLETLGAAWAELAAQKPGQRIREAAAQLGVSEADLLATRIGKGVAILRNEPKQIFPRLAALGSMMALTRNDYAVHERHGVYQDPKIQSNIVLVNNEDIDLRIDLSSWTYAFHESKEHAGKTLRSIQFFDATGTALHKIYLDDESKAPEFESLITEFAHPSQTHQLIDAGARAISTSKTAAVSQERATLPQLLEAWEKLVDTHRFDQMHTRLGLERLEAIRMAEGVYTTLVDNQAAETMLRSVAKDQVPIMVFIGNQGCIQIHTGTVTKIQKMQQWVNVFDPDFNLHLNTDGVVESWVVSKPTKDGPVHSLELYAADGSLIVQFFGKRKPGIAELPAWRQLVESLR